MADHCITSPDNAYRYLLTRTWDPAPPVVAWVMLNPSTADDRQDDPTIRKVRGFSQRWGFGGVVVVNLFPLRSTDPAGLRAAGVDRHGPLDNGAAIWTACHGRVVVLAWGAHGARFRHGAVRETMGYVQAATPLGVVCLGRTGSGEPRHPLMLGYGTPREVVDLDREIERCEVPRG